MTRLQKHPQNKIEKSLAVLPQEEVDEFYGLVKANSSHREIVEWFALREISVTAGQVGTWWKRHRPRGHEMIALNAWAEQFRGADEEELLELAAGLTANLVKLLYADYDADNVSGNVKLQSLLESIRELRQITELIRNNKGRKEEDQIQFEGAIALRDHLIKVFKDTSFEDPMMIAVDDFLSSRFNETP